MSEGLLRRMLSVDEETIIMDGGMGSAVEDRGVDVRSVMWGSYCFVDGLSREINDQTHADYIAAGARILIANTHNIRRAKCVDFLNTNSQHIFPVSFKFPKWRGNCEVICHMIGLYFLQDPMVFTL